MVNRPSPHGHELPGEPPPGYDDGRPNGPREPIHAEDRLGQDPKHKDPNCWKPCWVTLPNGRRAPGWVQMWMQDDHGWWGWIERWEPHAISWVHADYVIPRELPRSGSPA